VKTIQVREIPDDAYDTIRQRAQDEGKSLQSYMRDQVIALASRPSKRETVQAIEEALAVHGPARTSTARIADDVQSDRR
jgi:antitoxin FitA